MADAPVPQELHAGEQAITAEGVQALIRQQFPQWTTLPLHRIESPGTDHVLFRLGSRLAVRLPRTASAALQVEKLQRWLPELAPRLPLPVPMPVAQGAPAHGYPFIWSVTEWLEGDALGSGALADPGAAAQALGEFVVALRRIDTTGGPRPGEHNAHRGCPLAVRDARTRACLAELDELLDTAPLVEAWQHALDQRGDACTDTWIHGDLVPGNLLQVGGRLAAVIDFGLLGVGDPATDVMAAWTVFGDRSRARLRDAAEADDSSWARGRGWALSFAAIALPYYRSRSHPLADVALRTLRQVDYEWRKG